jgi:hypothetical protein
VRHLKQKVSNKLIITHWQPPPSKGLEINIQRRELQLPCAAARHATCMPLPACHYLRQAIKNLFGTRVCPDQSFAGPLTIVRLV